jgi:hypothetical protein
MIIPIYYGKIKFMFQTTNQVKKSNSFLMSLVILQLQVHITSGRGGGLENCARQKFKGFFSGRVGTMDVLGL